MLDVFTQFEQSAQAYDPMVLVVPGLVGLLLGIFLWLGGSLFARSSVAAVWLVLVACTCVFFVKPLASVGIGVITALVVLVFKRFSTAVLASVVITFVAFMMACQYVGASGVSQDSGPVAQSSRQAPRPLEEGERLGIPDSFEHLKLMLFGVYSAATEVWLTLEVKYQVVLGVTAFFALLIGCVLQRLTEAVSFAATGVLFIWGGMVLMLLSKGAMPLTGLFARAAVYAPVIPAMIGVGAVEQLLFCSRSATQPSHDKAGPGKKRR